MRSPKGHDVDERVILEKVVVKSYVGILTFKPIFKLLE